MKYVGICGNFGLGRNTSSGQIIKTKVIARELTDYFGDEQVMMVDTCGWVKHPLRLLINCIRLGKTCRNILILPAQNGIKVFVPLFLNLNRIFKRKIHYSVIGGWLPELLSGNRKLLGMVKELDFIYVETNLMKENLDALGLNTAIVMPNFKNVRIISDSEIAAEEHEPYKLCTFSRVKKEKGILDAMTAVGECNKAVGRRAFVLDIYGTVEPDFHDQFFQALSCVKDCVEYKGVIPFDQATDILKRYTAMLFPTYYEGEGFPGTIIDAFSAGLPVIATDWRYNSEIVIHGETGWIYDFKEDEKEKGLIEMLWKIEKEPDALFSMKKACIKEAVKYEASTVMQSMISRLQLDCSSSCNK